MNDDHKSLRQSLIDFFRMLEMQFRAALSTGFPEDDCFRKTNGPVDPDLEAWLQNDPMVTGSAASRYRSQPPGYLSSNGRGSLEIGAAED